MPLVNAKCTNCGANLKVDSNKDAAICEFCNSAFIVEKAVNNYHITNQIHADIVNIYEGTSHTISRDFEIVAGVLKEYKGSSVDVDIPEGVCEIGVRAFAGMSSLRNVTLPSSVCKIAPEAFCGCESLTCINIPDSVTRIAVRTFYGCINLQSITIPSGVTTIEAEAFAYCEHLLSILLPDNLQYIGYAAFHNCKSLASLNIPNSVLDINWLDSYDRWVGVVDNCSSLKDIIYPTKFRWDTFRGSLWYELQRKERQESISRGICPDHKRKLSFFGQKCPVCGNQYTLGDY